MARRRGEGAGVGPCGPTQTGPPPPVPHRFAGLGGERGGGASLPEMRPGGGCRQSVFRSYVSPYMDRPNLTVLTGALVTRVTLERGRATGVEFAHNGQINRVGAGSEVVLALGAIHTPKVLMQSGVGEQADLQRHG